MNPSKRERPVGGFSPTSTGGGGLGIFASPLVDRIRQGGNVWNLPGGRLVMPEVFGFCRGVERALVMLDRAVAANRNRGRRLFLLGQIIHNPWVNDHFSRRGVRILGPARQPALARPMAVPGGDAVASPADLADLERIISPVDLAIIPAFGVPLPIEQRLRAIGCRIIDTTCGDVRRLWSWATRAVAGGYGVLIFGKASHDETVVTKSRLQALDGKYLVVGDLDQGKRFCDMMTGDEPAESFRSVFDAQATNASCLDPFFKLAQVSQTTMLYDQTIQLREMIRKSFAARFGEQNLSSRLIFQPTVCRATQARQTAAVQLCQSGCDLVIVVGGFGSSNTRHLFELAREFCPAYFIEDADAILSDNRLRTFDPATGAPVIAEGWLPPKRPLRIGVLAGASSPEVVVGEVLQRLGGFLAPAVKM
jgi:4-hydroxy-3-methylbut-2-enyl diphosphate reductase